MMTPLKKRTQLIKPLIATLLASLFCQQAIAQELPATGIQSIDDLKRLETSITATVKKVHPATVALTSADTGSTGSGVVVSETGLILTAAHVIQGNDSMSVIFPDGEAYVGTVLGANYTKDIAMVQLVKQQKWPFAPLGNSQILPIGSHVIALGNAGGFDPRRKAPARLGRLLSKNRNGFITTDCALIGGDSGGPLFDIHGNVIGINSSIGELSATNNHAGITSLIEDWEKLTKGDTWGQLVQNPLVDPERPMMGFGYQELKNAEGVMVINISRNSPAHKAGLRRGDIILGLDNEKITNGRDLNIAMSHHHAGDRIVVTALRKDSIIKLNMTLTRFADLDLR